MYDVIFISYDEPNADENFLWLQELVPNAKRVHGVEGIMNAHKAAANLAKTHFFWVVDGDNRVREDFRFDQKWESLIRMPRGTQPVGFWAAKNSVNDLVYGHGGIKLLPRRSTLALEDRGQVDITHSITEMRYYFDTVGSTTVINASAEQAWRTGFREGAKLAHAAIHGDDTAAANLEIWTTKGGDRPFGVSCISGARAGSEYVAIMHDASAHGKGDDPSPGPSDYVPNEINSYDVLKNWYKAGGPTI